MPSDSFVSELLGFDSTTKSEAHYYCIDTSRSTTLLYMIKSAGIPIPTEVIQVFSKINNILQYLNVLNIIYRFDGMIITTDSYAAFNAAPPTVWLNSMIAKVPEYSMNDFIDEHTGC